jgi:Na+/H+ antiporter NhaD/arsenite permease-like protein
LQQLVEGREVLIGVVSSQAISNVPAALLLSGFTSNYRSLLVGVNLGGLGTLIASMASLISYKILANKYDKLKGKYFLWFTLANVAFLVVLLGASLVIE